MSHADDRIAHGLVRLGAEYEPPAGWERRALGAIEAPLERRRRWLAIPLAALAVAAVLVARGPGPACRSSGDELTIDQVVALSSQAELPVPGAGYDVAAATAASATTTLQVVEVQ